MRVKVTYEKTQWLTATAEVNDSQFLEYVNNGGEHDYTDLTEARAGVGEEVFNELLEEFIDEQADAEEAFWTGVQDAGTPTVDVDKVEVA